MNHYKLFNNIIGWLIGIAACAVYIMTAEATASWWDCGEYIATSVNLEVGHPPGAPTFQLFGRLFSMFSTPETAAFAVNTMSAVVSGLGIMFLFWTITLLGKLIIRETNPSIKDPRTWAIFASGIVGAMCYCFSDTYWFSAVEGEVYATSSFFTAIVFWAILKWEEQSEDPHSLRWLILVCFLVGLAIGVHLLNLLTIPAIVYVVYFKKWKKTTVKGFIWSGIISVALLGIILWGVIPYVVNISSSFDVFFVNSLHMGFNTGTVIFFLLLLGAIAWGLWYTSAKKKNKPIINAAILGFLMLLVGYSTFFILVIRSNTNTPLNENAPKDAVALRAYLGREQYGDTPFLTGQYYTAGRPISSKQGYAKYIRGEENGKDRYILKAHAEKPVYNEKHCGVFPRMYSNDDHRQHVRFYKYWAGEPPVGEKPTMGQNLKYFNGYQLGWMYWRYFMWNFAGRQNDIQGHYFNDDGSRDFMNGNWICGIKFIDNMRLGPQDNMPDAMKNNKGRNVYYLLPLILGIIGLVYHAKEDKRGAFVNFIMFFMTGIAIAIYLNMPPRQPRERDYAFVGSFYFYAVWVGLGVLAICDWIGRLLKKNEKLQYLVVAAVFALCFVAVPVKMCAENWDDHDRSQKTAARDFAKNYLGNLSKNSVLVTFGDNDTFPLWYIQEVEHWRDDVRILNFTLSGMHWYIEQLYNKLYDSDALPLTLPYEEFYGLGEDVVYLDNRNDNGKYYELIDLLRVMRDNPNNFRQLVQGGQSVRIIPTTKFKITLDIDKLVSLGKVTPEQAATMDSVIYFEPKHNYLMRCDLMMLDFIATNGFERDIYLMSPGYIADAFPLATAYSQPDGMVYKLRPYPVNGNRFTANSADYFINGHYNEDGTRTALQWGNLNQDIYVDPISLQSGIIQRQNMTFVARQLMEKGDTVSARKMLDICEEAFPAKNFPRDRYVIYSVEVMKSIYGYEKAEELWNDIFNYYAADLAYLDQYVKSGKRHLLQGVRARLMDDAQALYGLGETADRILGNHELSEKAHQLFSPYEYLFMQPEM